MWNLKWDTKELSLEQKQIHGQRKQNCGCQGGGSWGRDGVEGWGYQM